VNVEIVVTGALGDLAIRAFADLAVERRQVVVASAPDTLDALYRLTARGIEILAVRERPDPDKLTGDLVDSGEAPSGRAFKTERAERSQTEAESDTEKVRIIEP
jgi:hypothetical protein